MNVRIFSDYATASRTLEKTSPPSPQPGGGGFEPTLSYSIWLHPLITMVTGGSAILASPMVTIQVEVTLVTVPVAMLTVPVATYSGGLYDDNNRIGKFQPDIYLQIPIPFPF